MRRRYRVKEIVYPNRSEFFPQYKKGWFFWHNWEWLMPVLHGGATYVVFSTMEDALDFLKDYMIKEKRITPIRELVTPVGEVDGNEDSNNKPA